MSKYYDIFLLVLTIACLVVYGHSEFNRGRINLCNEVGGKYLYNDSCISNDEYNLRFNNSDFTEFQLNPNLNFNRGVN